MFKLVIFQSLLVLYSLSLSLSLFLSTLIFVMSVQDTKHICWNLMLIMMVYAIVSLNLFLICVYRPVHIIMLLRHTKAYMMLYAMYAFVVLSSIRLLCISKRNKYLYTNIHTCTQPVECKYEWQFSYRFLCYLWRLTFTVYRWSVFLIKFTLDKGLIICLV